MQAGNSNQPCGQPAHMAANTAAAGSGQLPSWCQSQRYGWPARPHSSPDPPTGVQVCLLVVCGQQAAVLGRKVQTVQDLRQGRAGQHSSGDEAGQAAQEQQGAGEVGWVVAWVGGWVGGRPGGMGWVQQCSAGSAGGEQPAASAYTPALSLPCAWPLTRKSCAAARAPPPGTAAPCLQQGGAGQHSTGQRSQSGKQPMGDGGARAAGSDGSSSGGACQQAMAAAAAAAAAAAHRWCTSQRGRVSWG